MAVTERRPGPGVIHHSDQGVQYASTEYTEELKALGFQTSAKGCRAGATPRQKTALVSQPCAAFDGCRCGIYAQRPQYCRKFECLLLKGVQAEKTEVSQALGVIRTARQRAERVRKLLHDLADTNEHLPLALRFRRMTRRVERLGLEDRLAETYGELTLAFHDLNRLLSDCFYPHRG